MGLARLLKDFVRLLESDPTNAMEVADKLKDLIKDLDKAPTSSLRIAQEHRVIAEVDDVRNVSVFCRCEGGSRAVFIQCRVEIYKGDDADRLAMRKMNELRESISIREE